MVVGSYHPALSGRKSFFLNNDKQRNFHSQRGLWERGKKLYLNNYKLNSGIQDFEPCSFGVFFDLEMVIFKLSGETPDRHRKLIIVYNMSKKDSFNIDQIISHA